MYSLYDRTSGWFVGRHPRNYVLTRTLKLRVEVPTMAEARQLLDEVTTALSPHYTALDLRVEYRASTGKNNEVGRDYEPTDPYADEPLEMTYIPEKRWHRRHSGS